MFLLLLTRLLLDRSVAKRVDLLFGKKNSLVSNTPSGDRRATRRRDRFVHRIYLWLLNFLDVSWGVRWRRFFGRPCRKRPSLPHSFPLLRSRNTQPLGRPACPFVLAIRLNCVGSALAPEQRRYRDKDRERSGHLRKGAPRRHAGGDEEEYWASCLEDTVAERTCVVPPP